MTGCISWMNAAGAEACKGQAVGGLHNLAERENWGVRVPVRVATRWNGLIENRFSAPVTHGKCGGRMAGRTHMPGVCHA
jgi:hypothetical protein